MDIIIKKITAREVLDSRGNPTIEVEAHTKNSTATAIVPSGASTGKHEALELRDGEKRYLGKGVRKAVMNVNRKLARKIKGRDCREQKEIDRVLIELDGTNDKSNLGANSILGVSMAVAKLAAISEKKYLYVHLSQIARNKRLILPVPYSNVINGGKHAGGKLAIQEFMIAPVKAKSFSEGLRAVSETYHSLKKIIAKKYGKQSINVGDEGGFAPNLETARDALALLEKAVDESGYQKEMKFAIDAAASEFFKNGQYQLEKKYSAEELIDYYLKLIKEFPIISLEDTFHEDDFDSFAKLTKKAKIQIVGDDLLVTNTERIKTGLQKKSCNCLLLKVNQIGTLTEAIEAYKLVTKAGWNVMVSHRSGETEDSFIADLAVGLGTGQIKTGAPARGERTAKYNQLLRIEEHLGKKAAYGK